MKNKVIQTIISDFKGSFADTPYQRKIRQLRKEIYKDMGIGALAATGIYAGVYALTIWNIRRQGRIEKTIDTIIEDNNYQS